MKRRGRPPGLELDGREISRRRWERGMNQVRLSEAIGVTKNTIYNAERPSRRTAPKTAERIADALGCEVADLLRDRAGVA